MFRLQVGHSFTKTALPNLSLITCNASDHGKILKTILTPTVLNTRCQVYLYEQSVWRLFSFALLSKPNVVGHLKQLVLICTPPRFHQSFKIQQSAHIIRCCCETGEFNPDHVHQIPPDCCILHANTSSIKCCTPWGESRGVEILEVEWTISTWTSPERVWDEGEPKTKSKLL